MKRLIAFGCSSVVGQGLPDVFDPARPAETNPFACSQYSWSALLAKLFNVEYVPVAKPANGNKKILHDVLNFEYKEGDKYFILWSLPVRQGILKTKSHAINMSPQNQRDEEYYTSFYEEYDHMFMDTLYKNYAKLWLEGKNIPFEFLYFQADHNVSHQTIPVYWTKYYTEENRCPDGVHASSEAHEGFAKEIYKCLTE